MAIGGPPQPEPMYSGPWVFVSGGSVSPTSPSYDNDAQAAAGGVQVGQEYRNGNFIMVRLS